MLGIVGANLFRANSTQHRQNTEHKKAHEKAKKPVISYDYFAQKPNLPHHQSPLMFGTHPNRSVWG